MDDTLDYRSGPVSWMSARIFGQLVQILYASEPQTLKELLKKCRDDNYSLSFRIIKEMQRVRAIRSDETMNPEARTVILSMVFEKNGILCLRNPKSETQ